VIDNGLLEAKGSSNFALRSRRSQVRILSGALYGSDYRRFGVKQRVLTAAAILALAIADCVSAETPSRITANGSDLTAGGRPFVSFGFNYAFGHTYPTLRYFDRPTRARLRVVRREFGEARRMGANTLRVFLEIGQFMDDRHTPRAQALDAYERLLRMAERNGLYLDVAGNLSWRPWKRDVWYDRLSERSRWRTQARFWRAVAQRSRRYDSVLCYELTSEPLVGPSSSWYVGRFGGLDFGQFVARSLGGRTPDAVARAWTRRMRAAIRSHDRRHLVTIGLLPYTSGSFGPANVADLLDLLTLHEYPRPNEAEASVDLVRQFAAAGKPVILGETFQLPGDPATQEEFLNAARPYLDGFLGFYDGREPSEVNPVTYSDHLYRSSLEQMLALRPMLLAQAIQ
jgi:Cellulase (glycosyl hydrolase family 5)